MKKNVIETNTLHKLVEFNTSYVIPWDDVKVLLPDHATKKEKEDWNKSIISIEKNLKLVRKKFDVIHNQMIDNLYDNDNNLSQSKSYTNRTSYGYRKQFKPTESSSRNVLSIAERISDRLKDERFADVSVKEKNNANSFINGPDLIREHFICLRPSTWLNDEVINFYMLMLKERDELMCDKVATRKPSHFFSTHFVTKMLGYKVDQYDYPGVKRWTKKLKVFSYDKIFFPINIRDTHWTLLVVYVQKRELIYYDSMNGSGEIYLKRFMQWVKDEARENKSNACSEI